MKNKIFSYYNRKAKEQKKYIKNREIGFWSGIVKAKLFTIICGVLSIMIGWYLQSIGLGFLAWVFFIFTGICVFNLFR